MEIIKRKPMELVGIGKTVKVNEVDFLHGDLIKTLKSAKSNGINLYVVETVHRDIFFQTVDVRGVGRISNDNEIVYEYKRDLLLNLPPNEIVVCLGHTNKRYLEELEKNSRTVEMVRMEERIKRR